MSDVGEKGNASGAEAGVLTRAYAWIRDNTSYQVMQQLTIILLLVVLCVYASLTTDRFWTWPNIVDFLLTNATVVGVVALGMTFVMVGGGFDLSVASVTVVCTIILVKTANFASPHGHLFAIVLAIAVTALAGTLLGAVNGTLISYVGVNAFVVTLSTMKVFRGLALIITGGGQTQQIRDLELKSTFDLFYDAKLALFEGPWNVMLTTGLLVLALWRIWLIARRFTRYADGEGMTPKVKAVVASGIVVGAGALFALAYLLWGPGCEVSVPIIIFAITLAAGIYLLKYTRFGHYIYALGGNEQATWLAGINTHLVKAATYAICGLTCAIAAVIIIGKTGTAGAESYYGLELLVIASVIVGGTPLGGGSGGPGFTLTGILLLKVIENLLTQYGIESEYREIVSGLIILVVVTIDVLVRKRGRR
ncbi:MAG: ABC transporter permease [Planctomycetota bacterium]|jgi:D-xylose transport system permease protein